VTLARAAGTIPAAPANLLIVLSRGGSFAAAGVLAALNAQADRILESLAYLSPLEALVGMAGISGVIWAALAVAWKLGSEESRPLASKTDFAVLAAVLLLSFLPLSYAAQAGLLLCGGYLFATSTAADASRRASLVLLALTGPLLWGRILLNAFAAPILALDARIVGATIGTKVDGNIVQFASGGHQFVIGGPCSSVNNISLAIVLWTSAAMLFGIRIDRRYVAVGVAMIAFMFALNIARLSAIGLFPAWFTFLHFGTGAAIFGWLGLVGAALLAALGVAFASARQR